MHMYTVDKVRLEEKIFSFKSILPSIIIMLVGCWFFPYFNKLGVLYFGLCFILALFYAIIRDNVLRYYNSNNANTLSFAKVVLISALLISALWMIIMLDMHILFFYFLNDTTPAISSYFLDYYTQIISICSYISKVNWFQNPLNQFEISNLPGCKIKVDSFNSPLDQDNIRNLSGSGFKVYSLDNPLDQVKINNMFSYISPLDQFEIRNLLSLDAPIFANLHFSLTNIRLYLTLSAFIALMLNFLATNYNKVISNRWSISQESIYATLNSIVINQINANKGQMYFPFMYVLFLFILVNNLIGMVPYSFASTSHFSLSFFISFTVVLGATILGFIKHGLKFFSLFVPGGCPLALLPLLVLIEFISYLARNVSLGLRLAANILSGHMLLNILSGFAYNIMTSAFLYFFIGLIPLAFIIAFSGLELGIAFIQAQVFVVLTCSYIKDALDLH